MASVEKSPEAERDLREVWHYIALDSETAATKVVERIGRAIMSLADFPLLGRERDDLAADMRCFAVSPYLICYRYNKATDEVQIIRVVHGARDLGKLF